MEERISFLFLLSSSWVGFLCTYGFKRVKSKPLEPCNLVTLPDFLSHCGENCEARPWLANKFLCKKKISALRKSDIHLSFFFASPLFDFNAAYTFFVSH